MTDPELRREQAREDIEDLPGETALGNPDPALPHAETPQQYEAEHTGQYAPDEPDE